MSSLRFHGSRELQNGVEETRKVSIESRAGLAFGDWLTEYIVFLDKWDIYRDTDVIQAFVC